MIIAIASAPISHRPITAASCNTRKSLSRSRGSSDPLTAGYCVEFVVFFRLSRSFASLA